MTFWDRYRTPPAEPEPVPAAEVADFGQLMLRQRDKALAERDALAEQLAAARAEIGRLAVDLQELRAQKPDQVYRDAMRQADQDRANCVRLDAENRELWLRIEDLEHRQAVTA